jgi:hypothetical protein
MRKLIAARYSIPVAGILLAGAASIVTLSALNVNAVNADDTEDAADQQAAKERKEKFTKWMRSYAEETRIRLKDQPEAQEPAIELVSNPVFRYSDEERLIPDATLWVWTRDARPVALQKVEGNNYGGGAAWTICFASLSEDLIDVRWPSGRRYEAQKPGVTFSPFPRAEPPAGTARLRTAQIKSLKERFTARLNIDGDGNNGAETRTMAKPVFEYADPKSKLPLGAIFGMTSTGTNPDLLLLVEARSDGDGNLRWEYACARMTSAALRISLDDSEIWTETGVRAGAFANWTFYFLPRDFK